MRKTNLFAALLAALLLVGMFAPQAEAQRWARGWGWNGGSYYAPSYYYSTPAYGYYNYGYTYPSYSYYSSPTYYYDYGYTYPSYSYYSGPTYYWSRPYYSGYYMPYNRGYVSVPWVNIGW